MGESSHMNDSVNTSRDCQSGYGYGLPCGYGDNKVVLMIRDPWTLFTYWETQGEVEDKVRCEINRRGFVPSKKILRVYDVSGMVPKIVYDFELKHWVTSWYVHISVPNLKWIVEVGILCVTGEFFSLAKSNIVQGPPYGMSDICDDEWMCSEELYYKLFAVTGGSSVGTSSMEMRESLERHLKSWLSSGGVGNLHESMFGSASFLIAQEKKRDNKEEDSTVSKKK
ncbi:hypothetical protein OMAG_001753 [Candidatus Omnitrophus magneticus]|uniref:DUF4912 domain-containing protein n=1 Tax=Candidatus Omnitrophus magneticus TaxID=1609969 RepID=A0A0F0CS79_9BACT|nr:hypothetical protein OMAG_001753 [Candidatus Omnitrophus magneticus]